MSAASAYVASGPLPSATYAGWDSQTKQEPLWVAAGTGGGQNAAGPVGAIQFSDGAGNFQGTGNATVDGTGVLTLAGDAIVGLNLNVGAIATVGTDLIVANDVTASGNISCGNLTLSGNAVVAGNVGATNMTASGAVSGASVTASGAVSGATVTAVGALSGSSLGCGSLAVTGVGTIATVSSGFSFGSSAAPLVLATTGTFQYTDAGNKGRFQISNTALGGSIFTIKGNPNVPGQVPTTTFLDPPPGALVVTPSFDSVTGCWTITINIGVIWAGGTVNFYVVYS